MPLLIAAQAFEPAVSVPPPDPQATPDQAYLDSVYERGCLRSLEAIYVAACIANPGAAACNTIAQPRNLWLLRTPLCEADLRALPPTPSCADENIRAGVDYCGQYGIQGPDPTLNALCWGVSLSPGELDRLNRLPPCGVEATAEEDVPVTVEPSPDTTAAETPAEIITDAYPREYELPVPEEEKPSTALYVVGGFLIVGVLGAGIYYATKKK